jgi:SAM-dependent methyltransferase
MSTQTNSDRLPRLSDYRTGLDDPYYLVYRTLFADLQTAAARAHGALLDIGCGNKPYERMFASRVTSHTGCDVTQSSEERVDVLCSATSIPLPSECFDTVLCTQVIEHVVDHQALLREAHRLLRPHGIIILSGPLYWPLHEEPHDYFRFTEHGFRYLLEHARFEKVEIFPNGGKWGLCGQVLIHTLEKTPFSGRVAVRLINRLFAYLDDRHPDRTNPMNYVVSAAKP